MSSKPPFVRARAPAREAFPPRWRSGSDKRGASGFPLRRRTEAQDVDGAVFVARKQVPAVRGPGQGDEALQPRPPANLLSRRGLPEVELAVAVFAAGATGQKSAVGRKG